MAAVAAAPSLLADVQMKGVGYGTASMLGNTGSGVPTGYYPPTQAMKPLLFSTFGEWWAKNGQKRLQKQARYVNQLDPDIAGFRLPLGTKIRLQTERNLTLLKEEAERHFLQRLNLFGHFEEYDHS